MIRIKSCSFRTFACVVALCALSAVGSSLQAAPITDFYIFALNQVMIGVGTEVHGLVGSGKKLSTGEASLNGTRGHLRRYPQR